MNNTMNDVSCSSGLENKNPGNASPHPDFVLPLSPSKSHHASLGANIKQNSLAGENEISPNHQPPSQPSSFIVPPSVQNDSPSSSIDNVSPGSSLSISSDEKWSFFPKVHHLLGNDEKDWYSSDDYAYEARIRELQEGPTITLQPDQFDIWRITDELREYYVKEFRARPKTTHGKIKWQNAADVFQKYKLTYLELKKVWQLLGLADGSAFTLEEFCSAMHLVVLKRNNIDFPDTLPQSLVPKLPKKERSLYEESLSNPHFDDIYFPGLEQQARTLLNYFLDLKMFKNRK